jgi:hypothetical protein
MKSSGNGSPRTCAENLLKCIRGEIPYERIKGLDATLIHAPSVEAAQRLMQDADWLVSTYEPRANVNAINVTPEDGVNGKYSISVDLTLKEG